MMPQGIWFLERWQEIPMINLEHFVIEHSDLWYNHRDILITILFSFAMNYFTAGFILASATRDYVDEKVPPFWQTYAQAMQMLLWPLLLVLIMSMVIGLLVINYILSLCSKSDSIQVKGLFKQK